jgi:phage shock protein PspC (stress-responsive transcriptional regulator)
MAIDTEKRIKQHDYYCLLNDVQFGPFDMATLMTKIDRDTLVWREGIEWEKACNVDELRKFFPEPQIVMAPISNHSFQNQSNGHVYQYEGFYCSSDDKVFIGFCGGLAHKYKMNPKIVRAVIFFTFFFYVGWLYFFGLLLPKHPTKMN